MLCLDSISRVYLDYFLTPILPHEEVLPSFSISTTFKTSSF